MNLTLRPTVAGIIAGTAALSAITSVWRPAWAAGNQLAPSPPMGWSGFNRFGRTVTQNIVKAEARAIIASGMKAAGYSYINLDGGWALLDRDAMGNLRPDPAKLPGGIKALAGYVHGLGLKLGIYTSAGLMNCAGTQAGSYGHYRHDAARLASWGVDYLKFDYCNVPWADCPSRTTVQVARLLARQMTRR